MAFESVDPITDVASSVLRSGNVVVWCEERSKLVFRHLRVVVGTDDPPIRYFDGISSTVGFECRFDSLKGRVVHPRHSSAPKPLDGPLRDHERLAQEATGTRFGVNLCPGVGAHCAKRFVQRMYVANRMTYRIETAGGTEMRTVDLTQHREELRRVMDECRVKPKRNP